MDAGLAQLVAQGIGTTLLATVLSTVVALPVAFAAGLARLSPAMPIRFVAAAFVEFTRGSSALVELYWAFFVLPLIGITLPALPVGVLVLGLNGGAYGSEIVRGSLLAVPRNQWEAAAALNISSRDRMWRIILPQAIPSMLPSFGNLQIDILKATSLLSLVTVTDVTRQMYQLGLNGTVSMTVAYTTLLLAYFVMSLPLAAIIRRLNQPAPKRRAAMSAKWPDSHD